MIATLIYFIVMGLVLILLGWLIYRNPNLINPYGDMPPEMKARVDIEGLKRSSLIALGVCGVLHVLAALLLVLQVFDSDVLFMAMTVVELAIVPWAIIAMRKYNGFGRDENGNGYYNLYMNKAAKITVVILMVVVAVVAVILWLISNRR